MSTKKFKFIIFILILFGVYTYLQYSSNITRIAPYPYVVKVDLTNLEQAQKANVLLMGDSSVEGLRPAVEQAVREIEEKFNLKISLFDWSSEIDNLSRVRTKIEALKTIPKVIIYHGTTNEMKEKKFDLSVIPQLKKDLKAYQNPKILTAIMLFPVLSRFIYSPPSVVITEKVVLDKYAYSDKELFIRNEYLYKLYELELADVAKKIKNDNSVFINITTPVDLEKAVLSCQSASTFTLDEEILKVKGQIKNGKYKESLSQLLKIEDKFKNNAEIYYLIGTVQLKMGNYLQGQFALLKAHSLNCEFVTNNPVFAGISRKVAGAQGTTLIDMFSSVNKVLGKDALFINGRAQEVYYLKLVNEIKSLLKQALI